MRKLTAIEERRFAGTPPVFDYLSGMETPRSLDLNAELLWLAHRCAYHSQTLATFLDDKAAIEELLLSGRADEALTSLLDHEGRLGTSLWSVSLQIGIRQLTGGVTDQKEYVASIRQLFRGGMLPFLANFFSQRAEEGVSIGWYIDNTKRRLARAKNSDIMRYVLYKALSQWPERASQYAVILRMEQNHHEIDVYETTVSAMQNLVLRNPDPALRTTLQKALAILERISDPRLKKVADLIGVGGNETATLSEEAGLSSLVEGRFLDAYRRAREVQKKKYSLLATAVAGMALSEQDRSATSDNVSAAREPLRSLAAGLGDAFSKRSQDDTSISAPKERARKFCFVFESLTFSRGLRALLDSQLGLGHRHFCESVQLAALNSPETTELDVIGASRNERRAEDLLQLLRDSPAKTAASLFVSPITPQTHALRDDIASLASSCGMLARGNVEGVQSQIVPALQSDSRAISTNAVVFALDAYAITGNISEASALLTREITASDTDPQLLPISPLFENLEWKDLKAVAGSIELSIALYLYAQIGGNGKTHTYRCFALETFLSAHGCERPSELRAQLDRFDAQELTFFLWRVCEPSVLDMLPSLESSRSVLEERRDICALLLYMYPGMPAFEQTLLATSSELTIRQGLRTLDASRVHVDQAALSASVAREISESYQRYAALIKEGASVSESFDSVIRELLKTEVNPKYLLAVPQSETADLLISMFMQVRQAFLFDPHHGLDSYLSKRIRHGSIVGYIRAPIEQAGIITQQNADGSYRPNPRWRREFDASNRRAELERAFLSFAKALDQHLMRLKDVLLHVRSDDKPRGVFDAPLTPPMYHLIRSAAAEEATAEGFAQAILAILQVSLNPSLQAAKALLERDTSRFVSEQFDTLRATVTSLIPAAADRADIVTAINSASTNAHAAIASVATWFEPITAEDAAYTMRDIVDIAVTSVKATKPGFNPQIHFSDHTGKTYRNLLILVDVLFVVFGNIASWSNRTMPAIDFHASLDADGKSLRINVENDVTLQQSYEDHVADIEARLERLRTGDWDEMVPKEGGSGLFKLASYTLHRSQEHLNCGYRSPERFFLSILLSVN